MPASDQRLMSSIKLSANTKVKPQIEVPESTSTHFYTAGTIVSYFPQINYNGYTFLRDESEPLAHTLNASLVDIQHVKKGYGVKDSLVAGEDNAVIGAICSYLPHDTGIDICVKIERSVADAFGFKPEDFEPGKGLLSAYSQECEFDKTQAKYVVVDKTDPTKIVKSFSYLDGETLGLTVSRVENGEWKYCFYEGNPVYMAVKPISFSGVGHVARPADPTAQVDKLHSSGPPLVSFVPGMDGENSPVSDMARPFMVADEYSGNDLTQYTHDFVTHPDLISDMDDNAAQGNLVDNADINVGSAKSGPDKYHFEPDDPTAPDGHYAACWSVSASEAPYTTHYADPGFLKDRKRRLPLDSADHVKASEEFFKNEDNSKGYEPDQKAHINSEINEAKKRFNLGDHEDNMVEPPPLKRRLFRIKSADNEYDRNRCIAAYQSLMGLRGNLAATEGMPHNVRQHALARVRYGLNATKPKINKETSSHMAATLTDADLNARIKELQTARNLGPEDILRILSEHQELASTVETLKSSVTEKDTALTAKDKEIEKLLAKIKEREDADKSNARFATLDQILAYTEDEKKDDKFPEFVKNLASLSDTEFKVEELSRALAASKKAAAEAPARVLSGMPTDPLTNPVPQFAGANGTTRSADISDIY